MEILVFLIIQIFLWCLVQGTAQSKQNLTCIIELFIWSRVHAFIIVLLLVYNQIMKKHTRVQYGLVNTIVEIKICASQKF